MNKEFHLQASSLRFALALWAGSSLALYAAFFLQLEPAQWAGISVWIMFIQTPRLNYAKLAYWSLGTIAGAVFAVALISACNQDRFLFLGGLTVWLSGCAFVANLVKSYNAYGAVLAGYTAGIISLSAIDHPEQVFELAVNRVSCIFVGMAAAVLAMMVFLPRHPHWRETVRHLKDFSREVFLRAAISLRPEVRESSDDSSWARVSDHLSLLEHTLAPTTAESAESRLRAAPARNVVASLFCLLAKSQSIEGCVARQDVALPEPMWHLLGETRAILISLSTREPNEDLSNEVQVLQQTRTRIQQMLSGSSTDIPTLRFLLLRLEEVLMETENVLDAWTGLNFPQRALRPCRLKVHRDHPVAWSAALRMTVAMTIAGVVWIATGWPSGAQFVLFTAVVCSLLTLQEDPRNMGWNFLKSAGLCAAVAFVDVFWILQKGEGFSLLACALGLFLVPAAYFYRKPALVGSAVPSMLLFYGLVLPSNQMVYDIGTFLNNTLGFLCATGFAFFAFHAVLPPSPPVRCVNLLKDIWKDIEEMGISSDFFQEQGWISLIGDRLRLLHHFGTQGDRLIHEREACLGLQIGLRRLRLQSLFASAETSELRFVLKPILTIMRRISTSTEANALAISRARRRLQRQSVMPDQPLRAEAVAELFELESLLQSKADCVHQHV